MQEAAERLGSQAITDQQKYISLLNEEDVSACATLCGLCFNHNEFDGGFDLDSSISTIDAIRRTDDYLAILWKEHDEILGVGLFLLVPSITSQYHKKVYEVAWDVHPDINSFKKGRIMVGLLHFMLDYYKGIADTAHFSVPCDNKPVQRYLYNKGFIPKEVCFVKEMK